MKMKRSPRRLAWFALCAAFLGCTQMVEFDRSKIVDHDAGAAGGGVGGGAGMDAGRSDSAVVPPGDGALTDTSTPEVDAGCSSNAQCAANELCCETKCIPTSANTGCESCNTPCSTAADTCTGRSCTCGTSASCSGGAPFCAAPSEGAANSCLECRGDDNCPTDGERQCVRGSCVECDVADGNSGCANPTPICDDRSDGCVGCDNRHPCGSGMQCVNGGCYGCDDATNAGCDPNGTTPICEPAPSAPQAGLYQCVGCTTDAQCTGNPNGGQCVAGSCEACDPRAGQSNAGCSGATPICDAATSTCRACDRPGDCAGTAGTCSESGPTAGRCVGCTLHSQCTGATPFCDPADGTCKACNSFPGGAGLDNAFCEDKNEAQPICDPPSGRCVTCNGSGGCSAPNDQCVISAAAPQNNICVDCVVSGATHTGCAAGEQCLAAAMPLMNRCVDCINDMGCSGMRARCAPNNSCVECLTPADCDDRNACTSDVCMSNTCSNPPLPVDDGIACTMDACSGGTVTHMPDNSLCPNTDGLTCTVPTCMPTTGCAEVPNHTLCTSATDCFADMCLGAGGDSTTGCSTASICDGGTCMAGTCMP
jgi:hypothetical protein